MQVFDRSLLVDFDLAPILIIDSDIFVGGQQLEAEVSVASNYVHADLECYDGIELVAEVDTEAIVIDLDIFYGESKLLPWYEGPYIVVPKYEDQELDTENKSMRSDVLVKEIGVASVTNLSGGYTVTIG